MLRSDFYYVLRPILCAPYSHGMAHCMHEWCVMHASTRLALFYPWDYVCQENIRPAVLVRESNTQLVRYSLDITVFKSLHRGPEFSHNYLIDYTIGYTIIITPRTCVARLRGKAIGLSHNYPTHMRSKELNNWFVCWHRQQENSQISRSGHQSDS